MNDYIDVPVNTEWLLLNHEIMTTCYLHSIDFYVATPGLIHFEVKTYNSLGGYTTAADKIDVQRNQPASNLIYSFSQSFSGGYQRYYFPSYIQVTPYTMFYMKCETGCLGADIVNLYTYDMIQLPNYESMSTILSNAKSVYFKVYTKSILNSAYVNTTVSKNYSSEGTYNFKGYYECNGITVSNLVPILVNTSAASQTLPPVVTTTTVPTTTVPLGKF